MEAKEDLHAINMHRICEFWAEHQREPSVLQESKPRLSWKVSTSEHGWRQSSYEIRMKREDRDWEVFRIETEQSVLVPWPSIKLQSREILHVQVRASSTAGARTKWSELLKIEAALLKPEDWTCSLIECDSQDSVTGRHIPRRFRKEFWLPPDCVFRQARLYITAHGIYEASINSQRVGDHVLAPGWTSYSNELSYQTYDVTDLISLGGNTIGVQVADGWFCGRLGCDGGKRNIWGTKLGVIAQLIITCNDGKILTINSDNSWSCGTGPIIQSELYDGEVYDSRLEDAGWLRFGYIGSTKWQKVDSVPLNTAILRCPDNPPIRRIQEVKAVSVRRTSQGKHIIDFGQNLVGWLRLQASGPEGHVITIRHCEVLQNGECEFRPLRECLATDKLILSGHPVTWEPRFTFHGFRYAEVTGWPDTELILSHVTAIVIHTDNERTGHFECSNALLNKLHQNIVWSMKGNFVGIPTDCPQRDERLGWTGDIYVFAPTASFLYNTAGMIKSWLRNLASEQNALGIPPLVSPDIGYQDFDPVAIWGDVVIAVPWCYYQMSGDLQFLQDMLPTMLAWMQKGIARDKSGLWDPSIDLQLGDWLDPLSPSDDPGLASTDPYLVADAFLIRSTDIMVKICEVLEIPERVKTFQEEAVVLRAEFASRYISPSGRLVCDSQTAIALAVYFELYPLIPQKIQAGERLEQLIRRNSRFKIATGFAGTAVIGNALSSVGKSQLFYRMLLHKQCPSWLYPVTMGATTVWERWDSLLPNGNVNSGSMTSFNHYALGAVADWMHSIIGGITATEPGWKRALVRPIPGADISYAKTSFNGPYGIVSASWEIRENVFSLDVDIPPNTTAVIELPGQTPVTVDSGHYHFSAAYEKPDWPILPVYTKFSCPPEDKNFQV